MKTRCLLCGDMQKGIHAPLGALMQWGKPCACLVSMASDYGTADGDWDNVLITSLGGHSA
jgi:hypothetical protein